MSVNANPSNPPAHNWVYVTALLVLGGGDQILLAHARALKDSGHRITLFSLEPYGPGNCSAELRDLGVELREAPGPRRVIDRLVWLAGPGLAILAFVVTVLRRCRAALTGLPTQPATTFSAARIWARQHFWAVLLRARVRRYLRENAVAGIHVFHPPACHALAPVIRQAKVTTIYTEIQSPDHAYGRFTPDITPILGDFSQLVAPSAVIARDLERRCTPKRPIRLIPFTTNVGAYARKPARVVPDRFNCGFIARLQEEKNHQFLLHALPIVSQRCPNARVLFAGEGPARATLEQLAKELDVGGAVQFLGHFDPSVLPSIMEQIDLFVLPSTTEGMPQVLVEAMAFGKPIVATPVGAVPEMVEEGVNGFLVPVGEVEILAQRISQVLLDPALRRRLGEAGRQRFLERYDISIVYSAIRRLCDDLAAGT